MGWDAAIFLKMVTRVTRNAKSKNDYMIRLAYNLIPQKQIDLNSFAAAITWVIKSKVTCIFWHFISVQIRIQCMPWPCIRKIFKQTIKINRSRFSDISRKCWVRTNLLLMLSCRVWWNQFMAYRKQQVWYTKRCSTSKIWFRPTQKFGTIFKQMKKHSRLKCFKFNSDIAEDWSNKTKNMNSDQLQEALRHFASVSFILGLKS